MQIFEDDEAVSNIYQRALSLAISKDFADQENGKITNAEQQDSEQENRRRELLAVEKQANKDKIIAEHGKNHFKTQVLSKFLNQVKTQINVEFENKDNLYNNVLHIEEAAPSILEILSLKAASINRITPLAKSLPWLSQDLLKLVNKPQYRKRADVQVTKTNLALSYIGLDNLKLLVPTFVLKHWLPISTAPFPLLKRKLWNDSLAIGLGAKFLAEEAGLDGFTAFTCGMFSNIGHLAVTRCVLNCYNEMYKNEVKEAYEGRDKRLHDVLVNFTLSPDLLLEQLTTHSSKIAADLVELMRFDRLTITEPIFDLAYGYDVKQMHPIAQLVAKSKAYVVFRSLAKEDLISTDEAKLFLSKVRLTPADITLLKKSDIDHIKLNFN
jgi:hypothetical protein